MKKVSVKKKPVTMVMLTEDGLGEEGFFDKKGNWVSLGSIDDEGNPVSSKKKPKVDPLVKAIQDSNAATKIKKDYYSAWQQLKAEIIRKALSPPVQDVVGKINEDLVGALVRFVEAMDGMYKFSVNKKFLSKYDSLRGVLNRIVEFVQREMQGQTVSPEQYLERDMMFNDLIDLVEMKKVSVPAKVQKTEEVKSVFQLGRILDI